MSELLVIFFVSPSNFSVMRPIISFLAIFLIFLSQNVCGIETVGKYNVEFFPEGGNLIYGEVQKTAVKVYNNRGRGILAEGVIINEKGDTVSFFKTEDNGIGLIAFQPEKENNYKAVISINKETGTVAFPKVSDKPTIELSNKDNILKYRILYSGKKKLDNYSLYIDFEGRNITLDITDENREGTLDISEAPPGVMIFSLLDVWGRIVSERIFGVISREYEREAFIFPDKISYQPGENIHIQLEDISEALSKLSYYNDIAMIAHRISGSAEDVADSVLIASARANTKNNRKIEKENNNSNKIDDYSSFLLKNAAGEKIYTLEQINVIGEQRDRQLSTEEFYDTNVIQGEKLQEYAGGDLIPLIERLTNVKIIDLWDAPDLANSLGNPFDRYVILSKRGPATIQGSNLGLDATMSMMIDGIYVSPTFGLQSLDVSQIEKIERLTGPRTASLGMQGFRGVINIETKGYQQTKQIQAINAALAKYKTDPTNVRIIESFDLTLPEENGFFIVDLDGVDRKGIPFKIYKAVKIISPNTGKKK